MMGILETRKKMGKSVDVISFAILKFAWDT